jgi:hypothetical protein
MLEEEDRDSVVDELYVTDRTRFKQAGWCWVGWVGCTL